MITVKIRKVLALITAGSFLLGALGTVVALPGFLSSIAAIGIVTVPFIWFIFSWLGKSPMPIKLTNAALAAVSFGCFFVLNGVVFALVGVAIAALYFLKRI